MKYLIPVMLLAVLVTGCKNRIDGQLNVTKDIKLRAFSGDNHMIKVGTYTADLSSNGNDKIALRINEDKNERFNFAIPSGSHLPDNGTIAYSAAQVGQNVDIKAVIRTAVTDGPMRSDYQSCTYQAPVQVCYPTGNGGVSCSIQYQTVWGQQWQQYFNRSTDKNIVLDIFEPAATDSSAQFIGNSLIVERIIMSQSPCR